MVGAARDERVCGGGEPPLSSFPFVLNRGLEPVRLETEGEGVVLGWCGAGGKPDAIAGGNRGLAPLVGSPLRWLQRMGGDAFGSATC